MSSQYLCLFKVILCYFPLTSLLQINFKVDGHYVQRASNPLQDISDMSGKFRKSPKCLLNLLNLVANCCQKTGKFVNVRDKWS